MTDITAVQQQREWRTRSIFRAASARSTKLEGPLWAQSRHSLRSVQGSALRDFAVIHFSRFADAAFVRSCGTCDVATQRVSSIRSFMSVVLAGTESEHSPDRVWNRKMLTIRNFTLRQKDLRSHGKRSDQNHVRY